MSYLKCVRHAHFQDSVVGTTEAPGAHKTSLTRLRDKLKVIFRRSRGTSLKFTISRVSQLLRGGTFRPLCQAVGPKSQKILAGTSPAIQHN